MNLSFILTTVLFFSNVNSQPAVGYNATRFANGVQLNELMKSIKDEYSGIAHGLQNEGDTEHKDAYDNVEEEKDKNTEYGTEAEAEAEEEEGDEYSAYDAHALADEKPNASEDEDNDQATEYEYVYEYENENDDQDAGDTEEVTTTTVAPGHPRNLRGELSNSNFAVPHRMGKNLDAFFKVLNKVTPVGDTPGRDMLDSTVSVMSDIDPDLGEYGRLMQEAGTKIGTKLFATGTRPGASGATQDAYADE